MRALALVALVVTLAPACRRKPQVAAPTPAPRVAQPSGSAPTGTPAISGAMQRPEGGDTAATTAKRGPADVIIVPSAQPDPRPGSQGSSMGTWARGIARLAAHEAGPGVNAMAVLPIADVDGKLSYAIADLPLQPDGVVAVFEAYRPRFVVALHVAIEDRLIEVVQSVWKAGEPKPVLARRYPWKLDDAGRMLDDALDDLVRAVGGTASARGTRLWSRATKPEALESFLSALDVGTLRAAARGRPLDGKPRETADLLRESLAADPGFQAAKDLLADPNRRFDRVIISERKLGAPRR